jgi:hypothetical protein
MPQIPYILIKILSNVKHLLIMDLEHVRFLRLNKVALNVQSCVVTVSKCTEVLFWNPYKMLTHSDYTNCQ